MKEILVDWKKCLKNYLLGYQIVACKHIRILLLFWLAYLQCYLYNLDYKASLTLFRISLQKINIPTRPLYSNQ